MMLHHKPTKRVALALILSFLLTSVSLPLPRGEPLIGFSGVGRADAEEPSLDGWEAVKTEKWTSGVLCAQGDCRPGYHTRRHSFDRPSNALMARITLWWVPSGKPDDQQDNEAFTSNVGITCPDFGDGIQDARLCGTRNQRVDDDKLTIKLTHIGYTDTEFGRTAGSIKGRIFVTWYVPKPSRCQSVEQTLDPDTMQVSGQGQGQGVAWRVVDTAKQSLQTNGTGHQARFSFTAQIGRTYQLQFQDVLGKWSTDGCTFSFKPPVLPTPSPTPVPPTPTPTPPPLVPQPALALDKNVHPPGIVHGIITFTIDITNTGPSIIDNLPLIDAFSGPMDYIGGVPTADMVDNVDQTVAWNDLATHFGNLQPDQTIQILTVFRITSDGEAISLSNTALISNASDLAGNTADEVIDSVQIINIPTAISLIDFNATHAETGILLTWETAIEYDNFGFKLLRGHADQLDQAVEIAFVVGQRFGISPSTTYTYLDDTAQPNQPYIYWLIDVDIHGAETIHKPIFLPAINVTTHHRTMYFLPVLLK